MNKKILAINASRARSGGGINHIISLINNLNLDKFIFDKIHIWCECDVYNKIKNVNSIIIHKVKKRNIFFEIFWETFILPIYLKIFKCDILYNVDGGSLCRHKIFVTMSRDMLAFEEGEKKRLGLSISRLRQFFLKLVQLNSFKNANGLIFLNDYAFKKINSIVNIRDYKIIPHGINEIYKRKTFINRVISKKDKLKLVYVSPIWVFKHQWQIVKACYDLINIGFKIEVNFIGGGNRLGFKLFDKYISTYDPQRKFVKYHGQKSPDQIIKIMKNCNINIFASTCENLPNTLLEAMSFGLPILSSDRGPMKSILGNGAIYFNPEDSKEICKSIKKLVDSPSLQKKIVKVALKKSESYNWKKTTNQTFEYLEKFLPS